MGIKPQILLKRNVLHLINFEENKKGSSFDSINLKLK